MDITIILAVNWWYIGIIVNSILKYLLRPRPGHPVLKLAKIRMFKRIHFILKILDCSSLGMIIEIASDYFDGF
jgi:hypothetical protein